MSAASSSKSETKSETKSKETPKASEPSSTESTSSESSSSDSSPAKSSSSGGGGSSRPISYFSSVSTNDYRDGWDSVFGKNDPTAMKTVAAKPKRAVPRRKSAALPVTIELSEADLDAAAREVLEQAFRRKAKAKRLNYDSLSRKAKPGWQLRCEFSG